MKQTAIIGSIFTFFLYVFISMFNHTWDIMAYSGESVYTAAAVFFLFWIGLLMFKYLEI